MIAALGFAQGNTVLCPTL